MPKKVDMCSLELQKSFMQDQYDLVNILKESYWREHTIYKSSIPTDVQLESKFIYDNALNLLYKNYVDLTNYLNDISLITLQQLKEMNDALQPAFVYEVNSLRPIYDDNAYSLSYNINGLDRDKYGYYTDDTLLYVIDDLRANNCPEHLIKLLEEL